MECVYDLEGEGEGEGIANAGITILLAGLYATTVETILLMRQGGGNVQYNAFGIAIALPRFRIAWSPYIYPFRMHTLYQAR